MEYVHSSNNVQYTWNIYSNESSETIKEYYLREQTVMGGSSTTTALALDKSLPRHHALVAHAFVSSAKLMVREFPKGLHVITGRVDGYHFGSSITTQRDLRDVYQKHHLIALSGMSGLLIARLFTTATPSTTALVSSLRSMKKHAQITTYYIHSALASEILIGNRYYRNIRNITSLTKPMGHPLNNYIVEDISPACVSATKRQLCELYASEIGRLNELVAQYKRGFVNLDKIQNDPEFHRLFVAFWKYSNQVMKKKIEFEKHKFSIDGGDSDDDDDDDNDHRYIRSKRVDRFNAIKYIKQFFVFSEIFDVFVLVPGLYNYDIVHLFDTKKQSFVNYVKSSRNTLIRLANDGITTAFLSFAAIEPTMVTPEMAPRVGHEYQTLTLKSCANHIPRRDPLYGALRVKHNAHIPRTATVAIYPRIKGRYDNIIVDDGIIKSIAGSEETQTRNRIQRTIQHIRKSSIRKLYLEVKQLEW